jgi:hypothetical protein
VDLGRKLIMHRKTRKVYYSDLNCVCLFEIWISSYLKLTATVLLPENDQMFFSLFLLSFHFYSVRFVIHYPSTRGWREEGRESVTEIVPAGLLTTGDCRRRAVVIG